MCHFRFLHRHYFKSFTLRTVFSPFRFYFEGPASEDVTPEEVLRCLGAAGRQTLETTGSFRSSPVDPAAQRPEPNYMAVTVSAVRTSLHPPGLSALRDTC